MLSPIIFSLYIDDLMSILSWSGVGCYICPHFVGALAYADDVVLIAPTASAMSRLLALCSEYAKKYSISFNAPKTKCLVVIPRTRCHVLVKDIPSNFFIDNNPIGFVDSFKHLGHIILLDSLMMRALLQGNLVL